MLEPGEEDGLLAGIRNSGHANVVIKNGTVRNFGYGVRLLAGARFNVVENMTLIGNINAGIELLDADDGRNGNIIRNNTFNLNGDGVHAVQRLRGQHDHQQHVHRQRRPRRLPRSTRATTASRATRSAG